MDAASSVLMQCKDVNPLKVPLVGALVPLALLLAVQEMQLAWCHQAAIQELYPPAAQVQNRGLPLRRLALEAWSGCASATSTACCESAGGGSESGGSESGAFESGSGSESFDFDFFWTDFWSGFWSDASSDLDVIDSDLCQAHLEEHEDSETCHALSQHPGLAALA
mmetsp:Transcript_6967/g.11975  ORF Transcript_6967/g.11975 Transcript_6967/m.11975 type:complete len:166 (-) Transcript_6967:681-1178(-)